MAKELPARNAKKQKKPFPWGKALCFLLLIGGYFALYKLIMPFFPWIMYINSGAAALLLVAFYIVNQGFSAKPVKASDLPREWTREKREQYAAQSARRKKAGRVLLYILVPMLFAILLDYLFYYLYESPGAPFYPEQTACLVGWRCL